jgi:DNA-binding LytR/AlgR family response regulator
MKARALIAEDEPLLAVALRADLAALWPGLEVVATAGDGATALARALALRPELCFLDIRMPELSGLEVAAALAEDWPDDSPFPLVVFVTAYDQHALAAFERQAVDYLVKPVQRERLAACVERCRRLLAARAAPPAALQAALEQLRALIGPGVGVAAAVGAGSSAPAADRLTVIPAQAGATVHLVPIEQVIYFEAADKYVRVVTAEREHLIRLSLRELLPRLDPQQFWQVHRGTVVRAAAITQARREDSGKIMLTLAGRPEKLTASRLYAHLFRGL